MSFATMLGAGPVLKEKKQRRNRTDEAKLEKVFQALPGERDDLAERTGLGRTTVLTYLTLLIAADRAEKKYNGSVLGGKRYIYQKKEKNHDARS